MLKGLSESFDTLRACPEFIEGTNGERFEKFPFMLSFVEAFFRVFSAALATYVFY